MWGGRYRGQRQKWFVMRFTGNDADIDLRHRTSRIRRLATGSRPNGCRELIVPFKRQLYIDILTEFRPHCRYLDRGD